MQVHFAPVLRSRRSGSLSLMEREEISRGLFEGSSFRQLGHDLGRAASTISRCRVAHRSETARVGRYSLPLNTRFCFQRRRFSLVSSRYLINCNKHTWLARPWRRRTAILYRSQGQNRGSPGQSQGKDRRPSKKSKPFCHAPLRFAAEEIARIVRCWAACGTDGRICHLRTPRAGRVMPSKPHLEIEKASAGSITKPSAIYSPLSRSCR